MSDRNAEIIAAFAELVELTTLEEGSSQSFRVRAYENAMHELELVRGDLAAMSEKELCAIEGIGKSTAKKIRELVETGTMAKLEQLRAAFPPSYRELSKIPGLGPKKLQKLRAELGIEDLEALQAAIAAQQIRELDGFGPKSEEKIAQAIERRGLAGKHKRTPIAEALPIAQQLVARLQALPQVRSATYCGSLRRFRETVADVDIVAVSTEPAPVMSAFVGAPAVKDVIGHGDTKSSVITDTGLQIDLRVVGPEQVGAAVLYFTGSKAHNIALRQRAIDRTWTLNEYGLCEVESGDVIASDSEETIYRALEMDWVPPPMREGTGEVALAAAGQLPAVPRDGDVAGDLCVRTSLSGGAELAEMVAAAEDRELAFLGICDRFGPGWAESASAGELIAQSETIARLRDGRRLRLLHGCQILVNGPEIDVPAELRSCLDYIVAVPADGATDRTGALITAMQDPLVRLVGRVTGRAIGARDPGDLDLEALVAAAAATQTAIAVDCALEHLDPAAELLRRAGELGAEIALASDASAPPQIERLRYGVLLCQRGWVTADRILNCRPDRLASWLAAR